LARLLLGLGNPGPRYRRTRHNVGFDAVDRILESAGARWPENGGAAVRAEAEIAGRRVTLMKPLGYMNRSGGPVGEWARENAVARTEILVYYDDVALPLGSLRLRERGTDGGHNGLASVIEELGGTDVPRVRIGIRPRDPSWRVSDLAEFVLSPFTTEERTTVDEALERVVEATRMVLAEGMSKAMSRYNAAPAEAGEEPLAG
jgi:PTH1 family peptidyl-tRNA hydrolase